MLGRAVPSTEKPGKVWVEWAEEHFPVLSAAGVSERAMGAVARQAGCGLSK